MVVDQTYEWHTASPVIGVVRYGACSSARPLLRSYESEELVDFFDPLRGALTLY
jgi:hypothetical protein